MLLILMTPTKRRLSNFRMKKDFESYFFARPLNEFLKHFFGQRRLHPSLMKRPALLGQL